MENQLTPAQSIHNVFKHECIDAVCTFTTSLPGLTVTGYLVGGRQFIITETHDGSYTMHTSCTLPSCDIARDEKIVRRARRTNQPIKLT